MTVENVGQILVVDHGEFVESGNHRELVKKEVSIRNLLKYVKKQKGGILNNKHLL